MAKKFSVVFDDQNTQRIETMAQRLRVPPDGLLLHFLLEKLSELEANGQKRNRRLVGKTETERTGSVPAYRCSD